MAICWEYGEVSKKLELTENHGVQYLHYKSVISFILTHLFSQISMFKMLCVTNNKTEPFCVEFWYLLLLSLFHPFCFCQSPQF